MHGVATENVVYLQKEDDLKSVLNGFSANNISHIPVINQGRIVGIVSKTDVVDFLNRNSSDLAGQSFQEVLGQVTVAQLMIQPVVKLDVEESYDNIVEKLIKCEVGSVLLTKNDRIEGIVTEKDMLRYIVQQMEGQLSFAEKMGLHIVQWLDRNGMIRLSRMLSEIGI